MKTKQSDDEEWDKEFAGVLSAGPDMVMREPSRTLLRSTALVALAERIATELMTVWDSAHGTEVERLQAMKRQPDGSERNLGGRNKTSVKGVILSHLEKSCVRATVKVSHRDQ